MPKVAADEELQRFLRSREGEAKLSRAAQKIRGRADFAQQMDRGATAKMSKKISKSEARAQARLDLQAEFHKRNLEKVRILARLL